MAPTNEAAALVKEISPPPPPGSPYSLPVPGTERENRTPIYRHWRVRDKPLIGTLDPNVQTIHELFEDSVARYPGSRCFGWRPWNAATKTWEDRFVWMTYAEAAERRKNLGAGIVELHAKLGVRDSKYGVGLWCQNRPEWQLTDLALASQSLFTVSLYETLGADTTEYIINHAGIAAVFCSLPHIPVLLKLAPRIPNLKAIVSIDPLDSGDQPGCSKREVLGQIAAQQGVKLYGFDEIEELGARSGRGMRPPSRDDVVTINYTSGTTGAPKGVVLTHKNAVAGVTAGRSSGTVSHRDVHMSYLPLAHIYGRMADQMALGEGAAIGFFRGDILGLVDDLKLLRPTGLFSVPRLYNRFNSALRAGTVQAPGLRGALSNHVVGAKKQSMRLPPGRASNKHLVYDRIWTPKVAAALGLQRAHSMVSGSAQLDPDVHEFLRAAFGNHFVQGYGLTESYATATVQLRGDFSTGNIGPPGVAVEVCLESVPGLDYLVTDKPNPRGELLLRGPIIFREYHKDEAETSKALEPDGWFHTGDICEIDSMGRIRIVDRKKNVLKLAQGEYISPERIENVYMGSTDLVNMAYVHGDPAQSSLVGIFGFDPATFAPFASAVLGKRIAPADLTALKAAANDGRVKRAFLKRLDEIARGHKFNNFERVRNVYMDFEPFSIANELLTPTLKLKRPQTAKAYRAQIDKLYEELLQEEGQKSKL